MSCDCNKGRKPGFRVGVTRGFALLYGDDTCALPVDNGGGCRVFADFESAEQALNESNLEGVSVVVVIV